MVMLERDRKVGEEVLEELGRARSRFMDMHSAHEGAAVIQEEFEELWDKVKEHKVVGRSSRPRPEDAAAMRKEAIQLAAMAIRFIGDVCGPEVQP